MMPGGTLSIRTQGRLRAKLPGLIARTRLTFEEAETLAGAQGTSAYPRYYLGTHNSICVY